METKRPRGRPKKAVSDRLPQFSIRLPPVVKLGLHFLARAKGISLSAAVQAAVTHAMRTEKFQGKPVIDLLREARGPDHKIRMPTFSDQEAWAEDALENPGILIAILPDSLRTPEERFFMECLELVGRSNAAHPSLLSLAFSGFRAGAPAEAVATAFRETEADEVQEDDDSDKGESLL